MKKVFLFFAVAAMFAACGPKAAEKAPEVETIIGEEVILDADSIPADSITILDTVVAE